MDFLVHDQRPGDYDAEIAERDARVFICHRHRNLFRQWYGLRRLQREHGPYDIVHSHVDYYGGFVVFLARLAGVRARIVNSHSDTRAVERSAGFIRRLYVRLMKFFVRRFATAGIGTSSGAAATLFGDRWRTESRWRVHAASVDLSRFRDAPDREQVRAEFGIEPGAIVFGHVGRFVGEKNHAFLIRLAEHLAGRDARTKFVLIGGGPLQPQIESTIRERGLEDRVIILGPRDDVARLMLGAMDFFLFPSRWEGLGLALVEAQAAGLRCFASTAVPTEAVVVPALVTQLPLSKGPEFWAEAIVRQMDATSPVTQADALHGVARVFDIRHNARKLVEFYRAATR